MSLRNKQSERREIRKMEERYEAIKELGAGSFGVARLVRDRRTKELLAVKYIERGRKVQIYLLASYS